MQVSIISLLDSPQSVHRRDTLNFGFTCDRYREIIEMEIDYLLQEFDSHLAQKLDEILQQVVVGGKPHCHRVLVFLMRRHRGESAEKAWKVLANNRLDGLFSGTEDTRKTRSHSCRSQAANHEPLTAIV